MRATGTDREGEPWHIGQVLKDWLRQHQTDLACDRRIAPARTVLSEHSSAAASIMFGEIARNLDDAHARGAMPVW